MNKIEIYKGWCKKCGICIAFCPRQVLGLDKSGYPVVKDSDSCTACQLCTARCPDFAIAIDGNRENDEKNDNSNNNGEKATSSPGK